MPKSSAAIFASTAGIASIMAIYLWHQLAIERDLNVQMQDRVTQLEQDKLQALQAKPALQAAAASTPQGIAAPASRSDRNAAVATLPEGNQPAANTRQAITIDVRELLKDPKFREAQGIQVRLQMPQNYPDVARELGLSPAEADAFFDLLARQQIDKMVRSAARAAATDEAGEDAQEDMVEALHNGQAEIAALLGPVKNQAWQDYQENLGARKQVSHLRATLSAAGYPMTDAQATPLLATITAEQKRLKDQNQYRTNAPDPRSQLEYAEDGLRAVEESDKRILDAAKAYLNPKQLSALKSSMSQRTMMARAFARARRDQLDGTASGSIPRAASGSP